jgi:hypothetical protein
MPRRRKSASKRSALRFGSALALVLVVAGCTKGGQFDPTDIFNSDVFDSKKKVKGDREPVFPNGVPGTTTGVPPDLMKGYQPPPEPSDADAATPPSPAPKATAEAAAKPKPTAKPKPKVAAVPAKQQDSVWSQPAAPAVPAGPTRINVGAAAKPSAPAPSAQAPWPSPTAPAQQTTQPAWPNPPAPGTKAQ